MDKSKRVILAAAMLVAWGYGCVAAGAFAPAAPMKNSTEYPFHLRYVPEHDLLARFLQAHSADKLGNAGYYTDEFGVVNFVDFDSSGMRIPDEDTDAVLRELSPLWGSEDITAELRFKKEEKDRWGRHLYYERYLDGRRILDEGLSLHLSNGRLRALVTTIHPDEAPAGERAAEAVPEVALARAHELLGTKALRAAPRVEQVWYPSRGVLHAGYEIRIAAAEPLGDFRVVLDAVSLEVVELTDNLATYVEGEGRVYPSNPIRSNPKVLPLARLNALTALDGRNTRVKNEDVEDASEEDGRYLYEPEDTHFDEVMIYYHVDKVAHFVRDTLGYDKMERISAIVHYGTDYDNAFYSPWTGGLAFGDGKRLNDLAREAAVAYHEYTHAVTGKIVYMAYSGESGAINEGLSDYFGCTLTDDPDMGEWAVAKMNRPYMRRLVGEVHYPEDVQNEVHRDSIIFSRPAWTLRNEIGREKADKLVHQMRFYLSYRSTFSDALRGLLKADDILYEGAHKETIRRIFAKCGIDENSSFRRLARLSRYDELHRTEE